MIVVAIHSAINAVIVGAVFHGPKWAIAAVVVLTADIYYARDSR